MSVVSIDQLRLKKQMEFEKNLLKEIIVEDLHRDIEHRFKRMFHSFYVYESAIKEEAMEQAMEAFLLGAEASHLFLKAEVDHWLKEQYEGEIQQMSEEFADYLDFWYEATESNTWIIHESKHLCKSFFWKWWNDGLQKGRRRRKLRLD